jgi:hypothetical protein
MVSVTLTVLRITGLSSVYLQPNVAAVWKPESESEYSVDLPTSHDPAVDAGSSNRDTVPTMKGQIFTRPFQCPGDASVSQVANGLRTPRKLRGITKRVDPPPPYIPGGPVPMYEEASRV